MTLLLQDARELCLLTKLVADHMQVALVGTSVRKDVLELLEKRVRSRFSHQQLAVLEPCALDPAAASEARSPSDAPDAGPRRGRRRGGRDVPAAGDAPLAVLGAMLRLPARPESAATPAHADLALRFNAAAEAAVSDPRVARALAARHCWPSDAIAGELPGTFSERSCHTCKAARVAHARLYERHATYVTHEHERMNGSPALMWSVAVDVASAGQRSRKPGRSGGHRAARRRETHRWCAAFAAAAAGSRHPRAAAAGQVPGVHRGAAEPHTRVHGKDRMCRWVLRLGCPGWPNHGAPDGGLLAEGPAIRQGISGAALYGGSSIIRRRGSYRARHVAESAARVQVSVIPHGVA